MKTFLLSRAYSVTVSLAGTVLANALLAVSYADDFDAGWRPQQWYFSNPTEAYSLDASSAALEISKPVIENAGLQIAAVQWVHRLRGDFDLSVDFSDAQIDRVSGTPGNQIQLNAYFGEHAFHVVRSDEHPVGHNAHVFLDPPAEWRGFLATDVVEGTLRITREGSLVRGFLGEELIHEEDLNEEDVRFSFSLQNNGTSDATAVTFDHAVVSADEILWAPGELPLFMNLDGVSEMTLSWPDVGDARLEFSPDMDAWDWSDLPVEMGSGLRTVHFDSTRQTNPRFFQAAQRELVAEVVTTTGRVIEVGSPVEEGDPAYSDREFVYDNLPGNLLGAVPIRTPNDDKFETNAPYLSFQLAWDAEVYVAYDNRYTQRPDWLVEAFEDTENDLMIGAVSHRLFRRTTPAGTVQLGGNYIEGEGNFGMYTVLVKRAPVTFTGLSFEPLFVGSYLEVPVLIEAGSGVTVEDLDFVIPQGTDGGVVSLSRDEAYDPAHPTVLLLVGPVPGTYQLQAVEKASGKVLADRSFVVNARWPDIPNGPSAWYEGVFQLSGVSGAAWGGGSSTLPENHNVMPASGTRRVAILLLDTKTSRFTATETTAAQTLWQEVAFDGRMIGGMRISTADFFDEMSYGKFTIDGQVFGPVQLPGEWSKYLKDNGKYKGTLWAAAATAGDALINYKNFDSVACVIKTVPAAGTKKALKVWPHAESLSVATMEGTVALGFLDMPATGDFEWLANTLGHELGHNLGLGDMYNWDGHPAQVQARELFGLGLMGRGDLAHPMLVHRMMLGWVPASDLMLYNFQAIGGSVDETVTLHPAELGTPPAGRYSGIEVRIAPGWNYYFEYRTPQTTQFGDDDLWWPNGMSAANNRVLGTDVTFEKKYRAISRRKEVMVLAMDSDGDGPILSSGQDYTEQDITVPNFPTDFTAEVTHLDGNRADIHIQYGVESQPDPSIRPWNPPNYQSPDIEIRNARTLADPKWTNVPWENHVNTIVAHVKNRGALNAPGVQVKFYVKDYTVNGGTLPPFPIDTVTKDVNAGATVEFTTQWMPAKKGHYCILAQITHYQTPGAIPVIEATEYNNRAQSNYDQFISQTASPASRETASIKISNPYTAPAHARLRVTRSNSPLYRTFLEHAWLELAPGEERDVKVMFENAYGAEAILDPDLEAYIGIPCDVTIEGTLSFEGLGPEFEIEEEWRLLGGVSARIITGRATRMDSFWFDPGETFGGTVITVDDGLPVDGGTVILVPTLAEEPRYLTAPVDSSGVFQFTDADPWDEARAYYLAPSGLADCESDSLPHP